tara:strand:+ start:1821 stop:1982 length:162 start_codon:yes stop_codon:yes gene_type:complete
MLYGIRKDISAEIFFSGQEVSFPEQIVVLGPTTASLLPSAAKKLSRSEDPHPA